MYGTLARRGDDVPDRPHRQTKVLCHPPVLKVAPVELLEDFAAEAGPPHAEHELFTKRRAVTNHPPLFHAAR